jgi:signal transduction histidine kinase
MQSAMNIKLLCRTPEHPVYVGLDGDKFSQVIQNLISNALKFTLDGGTITLDLKEEKEHIIVIVADTRIGIPAQYHQSLFEK